MMIKSDICYRCSTRRRIQSLIAVRRLHEQRTATWRYEERSNIEAMHDMGRSIRESSQRIFSVGNGKLASATASSLVARRDSISPTVESWEYYLERQVLQRDLANAKETKRLAMLAEEAEAEGKEKRTQERLASIQQHLSRLHKPECSAIMVGNADKGPESEQVSRSSSSQGALISSKRPSVAKPSMLSSEMGSRYRSEVRPYTLGIIPFADSAYCGQEISVGAAMRPVDGSSSVRGFSSLRAEAPEFTSLKALSPLPSTSSMRAQAPEFRPLRHAPPSEPQMMRAPTAPRAMREGSLRQSSHRYRQKYVSMRGCLTLRGLRY